LLYFHFWCREFSRFARTAMGNDGNDDNDDREGKGQMQLEYDQPGDEVALIAEATYDRDRLWTIGQLTSATGQLGPVLLGLLFVLVIGFHPNFSPVAIPLSLLVVATLFVVLFVASTLSLRWHFHRERERVVAKLELNAFESQRGEMEPRPDPDTRATGSSKRLSAHRMVERVDELMEIVKPYGEEVTAAATLATAAIQEKSSVKVKSVSEELKVRCQQVEALSDGVFRSWNRSPLGWILGGGATIALVDLWVRAWTIGI
jgi:hypothetical protein